ncbi:MAG TPA: hypothetical protein VJ904_11370 [Tichowtungia sp.]|nr:hypothetical protein [Tichowtungia sp.]
MIEHPASNDHGVQLKLISRKMVHSLNNKLFIISSYSEFIQQSQTAEDAADHIREIQKAADDCQRIMTEWRAEADKLVPDPPGT